MTKEQWDLQFKNLQKTKWNSKIRMVERGQRNPMKDLIIRMSHDRKERVYKSSIDS